MAYFESIWTEYAPQQIAAREISEDVEYVIQHPVDRHRSQSTGKPLLRETPLAVIG